MKNTNNKFLYWTHINFKIKLKKSKEIIKVGRNNSHVLEN